MNQWPDLFANLNDDQSDKIWRSGQDQHVAAGTVLIAQGVPVDTIYFVIEGVLNINVSELHDRPVAVLGPGEIVGEMSFIDPKSSSATVIAAEDSHVFALKHADFHELLASETSMAAQIYQALCIICARRLRNALRNIGQPNRDALLDNLSDVEPYLQLQQSLKQFKEDLIELDRLHIHEKEDEITAMEDRICHEFKAWNRAFQELICGNFDLSALTRQEIGLAVQREVLSYILMSSTADRMYAKPRGYARDFYTFEQIHRDEASGAGSIGPVLDRCIMALPVVKAVQNRHHLLAREIQKTLETVDIKPAHVTSLACGPAREIFEVFASIERPQELKCTLIDTDLQALSYVAGLATEKDLRRHIDMKMENLTYLAMGRKKVAMPPQDLVYCAGLLDYLSDNLTIKLLDFIHGILKPGGRVILGNFLPDHHDKAFMDWVLNWKINHRSEADMHRLFETSDFNRSATAVHVEMQEVYLLAECIKAPL